MSDPFKDVAEQSAKEPSATWKYWEREIRLAKKREEKFRKDAKRVCEIYEAESSNDNSFNILYANTETLAPAIYNNLPRAQVDRRFKDSNDPLALQVATVTERTLSYLLDSPDSEYESYDALFRSAGLAALVPGRAVTWWVYDPKIEEGEPDADDDKPKDAADVAKTEPVSGQVVPAAGGKVTWETVCGEVVEYDKFLHGFAKRWKAVPWVAREHSMTYDDACDNFGKAVAEELEYLADAQDGDRDKEEGKNQGSSKTACVWEIWWKSRKQVVFWAPSYKSDLCKDPIDDPYGLTGFFPCPEPLQFMKKTTGLTPTPIYMVYEPQAKELNRISGRINKILNAMKVRGFYDGSVQGLKDLLSKDDNTLIQATNVAAMKDGAGANLSNAIWFMPLEMLVAVVKELYVAREQCKQVIYEITGIADIMRGNTQASETATAQNIKDKWGGLRLQNMQGAVQGYIRDCLRIVAELAGNHFDIPTFAGMTGLDYATPEQLQQAQKMTVAVQQAMLQLPPPVQQPSVGPSAPQPAPQQPQQPMQAAPPPPQIPPQIQQAMQQIQAIQAKPKWEDVIAVMRDNLHRGYKIDIETNSTLANTSAEEQNNINKAMTAIAGALQQFIPAVQTGVMTMPVVKAILISMCRRFEFGRTVEAAIEQMPDALPPAPGPSPEMEQQQKDIQAASDKVKADQSSLKEQSMQLEYSKKEALLEVKMAKAQANLETQAKQQGLEQTGQKIAMDMDARAHKAQMEGEKRQTRLEAAQGKHEQRIEGRLGKHEMAVSKTIQDSEAKRAAEKASEVKPEPAPAHPPPPDLTPVLTELIKAVGALGGPKDIHVQKDPKTGSVRVIRTASNG